MHPLDSKFIKVCFLIVLEEIKVQLLSTSARVPFRATKLSAGLDLYSSEYIAIQPQTRKVVNTDLSIQLPKNTYGQIVSRSGLAMKGIDVAAGVIDRDYTGEIKVVLVNNSDKTLYLHPGFRLAQLICKKIVLPSVVIVKHISNDTFERGSAGFGSTGEC